ncbi:MAG: pyridoxal phosphate-dependent aminotransferase [Kiritimatiellia bacterium]|jgi:aspartate aminotransferase|nr:pyridoxal phosphate-dependent aminotransferase [Kiritimatiellia bacterium]MDP6629692.1 pyridoxal phosphate-dependent aminotransferase [Kiritimatiellia bacterium]MDP6810931.1 pyridoxal phosphate-dependent aminotransferase [Kiritimatiellia bacterium]MDP7023236.1 pyridoxal phosphate-dependent aminotransferase [Kiritimatiellia bacterium]
MKLNETISAIAPSVTLAITSKAKAMAAEGREVFSFAAGEPDFDTPDHIKEAAIQALRDGKTKYSPAVGLAELRSAIAEDLATYNGLQYEPTQVVVSCGAKHTLFNIFMALLQPGDEVLIPAPFWLSYPEMVRVAGGKSVFVAAAESDGFKVTKESLQAAVTPKTRALILNSPSNPIGTVYEPNELAAIAEFACENDVVVIADEIYQQMVYDGVESPSFATLSQDVYDRTVTVNGFSKAYSMTGWRLGYLAGPMPLVKAISALQSHSTSGPTTFAQYGALAALKGGRDCVAEMRDAFAQRRAFLYERLDAMEGVTCVKPMGAFYMLPGIGSCGMDSLTFAGKLLDATGVAVVPGKPFNADANIRLSYACSMDNIREGMDRMEGFLKGL